MTADPAIRSHRSRATLAAAVALLLLLALPVRAYVAEPFAIPSESMAPTLRFSLRTGVSNATGSPSSSAGSDLAMSTLSRARSRR